MTFTTFAALVAELGAVEIVAVRRGRRWMGKARRTNRFAVTRANQALSTALKRRPITGNDDGFISSSTTQMSPAFMATKTATR